MQEDTNTSVDVTSATKANPAYESGRKIAQLVYILQAVGMFLGGLPILVGVIINYVKRDDVRDTIWESHFRWQIRTFWFSILWTVLGVILLYVVIGGIVLVANAVWTIYRAVKGWLNLNDGKAMY